MRSRVFLILALSVLGLAVAVTPAHALTSRVTFSSIACDGANKHVDFVPTGLGASINRFIVGVEASVIDATRAALLYMVVRAQGDETKQVLSLGSGSRHESVQLQNFMLAPTNALGQIPFTIDAACSPGTGAIQGVVTVYFFS